MADTYVQLSYAEWKILEETCRAFKETTHGEGTPWYHKSFRLPVGGTTWEFHAPLVKARMVEEEEGEGSSPTREQLWELLRGEQQRTAEQRTTIEELTQRIATLRDDLNRAQEAEEGG